MDDYISREAALDFLIPAYDLNISPQDQRTIGDRFGEFIKRIPAADVRPVKEGYWQEDEFKYLTCSVCGCDTNLYDQHGFPIGQRKGHPYPCFCPHCGADMKGGADG